MALGLNKIVLANAATNTAGAYFEPVTVAATSSGVAVPGGVYVMPASTSLNSNVVIQFNTSSNLASPTWLTASPSPVTLKDQFVVTNAAAGPRSFYRLKK